ncbi:MAG: GNAT family N-acetyltransferase [Verrucomicrobia bacterium]|nr:GNAT family N-acetyltransferase [Verrucomicrobiota bacterium]
MEAVSNQQSFQFLEPLPVPEEYYTELIKLAARVSLAVIVTGFCMAFGFGLSLTELGFSAWTGTTCGAVVGVAASLGLTYLIPFPSKIAQYRLDTLSNVYAQLGKDEKTEDKFKGLKNFLTYPLERFGQTYQNHMLHNALTFVGEKVVLSYREDLKKVWKVFLEHLNHTKVINADGELIELDFSAELDRLEGHPLEFQVEGLNPQSSSYLSDLEQIEALEKICMGKTYTYPKEYLREELARPGNGCVIARKKESQEILGYGWFHLVEGKVNISGIAISPGATMLNMGDQLLYAILLGHHQTKPTIQLQVRKSNPAKLLYEKWGFELKEELPNYCPADPPEDAELMELNWDRFEAILKRLSTQS